MEQWNKINYLSEKKCEQKSEQWYFTYGTGTEKARTLTLVNDNFSRRTGHI
jgi:hypothetical protein